MVLMNRCTRTMTSGRTQRRRDQNRTRWGGRQPKGWVPITSGTPLQVLLKTRMTELGGDGPPLSTPEVAARAAGTVSANTVSAIVRGKVANPSKQTQEALAAALEVSEDQLQKTISSTNAGPGASRPLTVRWRISGGSVKQAGRLSRGTTISLELPNNGTLTLSVE